MSVVKKQLRGLVSDLLSHLREDPNPEAWAWASQDDYFFFRGLAQNTPLKAEVKPNVPKEPAAPLTPPAPPVRRLPVARKLPPKRVDAPAKKTPSREESSTDNNETSSVKDWMELHPPAPAPLLTWQEARQLLHPVGQRLQLVEELPSDAEAQQISGKWRRQLSPNTVLFYHQHLSPRERLLLSNIAQAVDLYLAPCLISKEFPSILTPDAPRGVRLILISESCLEKSPELKAQIKGTSSSHYGANPVLVLAPLSSYLQHPSLKASLWESLCHLLSENN